MSTEVSSKDAEISLIGVSFRTLGIEGRELLAAGSKEPGLLSKQLIGSQGICEAAVLSTCNRFEVLSVGRDNSKKIEDVIQELVGKPLGSDAVYRYNEDDAVRHLFRVASSLDSMVLGEQQILGQVKQAYKQAVEAGAVGTHLHYLFQSAFSIAKKVRTNTGISQQGVSISYVAVRLAQQIFDELANQSVLVIGSGQMAELALLHLCSYGCKRIVVANRTLARAAELADRFGGAAISLDDVTQELARADIVIGSITADRAIIDADKIRQVRRTKPIFFIDLGVPRNFSPNIAQLDSVYLYNIDDLSTIAQETRTLRTEAVKEAEIIIEYGLAQFERWRQKIALQPEIVDFRARVRSVCDEEVRELLDAQGAQLSKDAYDQMVHRISQKLSHHVTRLLTQDGEGDDDPQVIVVTKE